MPIRNITSNYSGRNKDITITPYINSLLSERQRVALTFGKVSSYCAGIQKLIQRYIITLLTVSGSQPHDPLFGTNFLSKVKRSNLTTLNDLTHIFNFANFDVISTFKEYQSAHPNLPADEQLDTAVIDSIDSTQDSVTFKIKIYTMAGETVDFVVPISN